MPRPRSAPPLAPRRIEKADKYSTDAISGNGWIASIIVPFFHIATLTVVAPRVAHIFILVALAVTFYCKQA
ncbi:hypothetical protein V495_00572 [Pseudogymnoascus sp. VKM F-4514 (FW-929)]|nr:hypothetical protein V490_03179 [Pseudogymnoascus sp. VKM F-3557]KFY49540.1 hypothetical protein V495_00572 [Pseudogymnoascus sp. VKM F-4514 (FW-929)]KFY66266.1 hypothetical protein V497_01022 [Pseudogymnoascus sp. VKM F-4516 (FW-969)]